MESRVLEACARAAHEVNRAYCAALGDPSQPAWDQCPDWQNVSMYKGVKGVLEDYNSPEESHASWLAEKLITGWKYGPVKDPDKKEHPCFVPYDELPEAQKAKDYLFVATVKAMAEALR